MRGYARIRKPIMPAIPEPISHTVESIYRVYEQKPRKDESNRLGMGGMGNECDRALWYAFRWVVEPEKFDGRKLRLFETGKREEERMIDDLLAAGVKVWPLDPDTAAQWEVTGLKGHFVGKMDGQAEGLIEAPKTRHVLEFKTHNEKSFNALKKDGVQKSKPGHYAQMQLYMHFSGIERAFYLAHNKNTDELHSERIHYDEADALRLVARAERIIFAQHPPARLHDNPLSKAAWQCRYCPAFQVCHEGMISQRRNCRTCLSSTPVEGGWHCDLLKQVNDPHLQKLGCSMHLFIPDLVPGTQEDADIEARSVTYRMADGSAWIDGGKS